MSDEKVVEAPEEKKKNPLIKIIILVLVFLIAVSVSVLGTLFATGAFSKQPDHAGQTAEENEHADAGGHAKPDAGHGKPDAHGKKPDAQGSKPDAHGKKPDAQGSKPDAHGKKPDAHGGKEEKGSSKSSKDGGLNKKLIPKDSQDRFEKSYMELDDKKALVANVAGSRKVMQASLSLMTQYDDRVFQNVEKHRAALRSAALDVLRQVTEADLAKPDFRTELAKRLRDKINSELVRLENFGGIEEIFFTEFVYQ